MSNSSKFVRFKARGYAWTAVPDARGIIEKDPRATAPEDAWLVKAGPARRVWQFQSAFSGAPVDLFVKEYLLADARDRFKYLFQPSKAWREWAASLELARRGIAVPEVVAVGVRRAGPVLVRSILITRALGDVVPLEKYVIERLGAPHRDIAAFTDAFAAFLRSVHDTGVLHKDFHQGNILAGGPPSAPRFHLVDLHDVRAGAPLLYGERVENLAVLGRFFGQLVPRHWRLRFLKRYLGDSGDVAATAFRIEDAAERGMRQVWAKRDRRVFGNNKYFRHVQAGNLTGRTKRSPAARAALALFAGGDPFPLAEAVIKDTRSSKVGVFRLETPAGPARVLVKRRNPRGRLKALLDPLRSSRAMKGFFYSAAFEHRDVPAPRALLALDCRRFGCLNGSYVVLEYVEGAENLAECIAAGQASGLFQRISRERGQFLRRLARILRRMHWAGLSMRDLKAANILVYPSGDGVGIMISDLDAARLCPSGVPERLAMQNIARLYFDAAYLGAVTRREALEFLKSYLGPAGRATLSRWVSGISRHVKEKRATFTPKGIFATRSLP